MARTDPPHLLPPLFCFAIVLALAMAQGCYAERDGRGFAEPGAAAARAAPVDGTVVVVAKCDCTDTGTAAPCTRAAHIRVPAGCTSVGYRAFEGCTRLETFSVPPSVTWIGQEAFDGTGLVDATIPATVQTVDTSAFSDCHSLASVTIESANTTILHGAFPSCLGFGLAMPGAPTTGLVTCVPCAGVAHFVIPGGVTTIPRYAFQVCVDVESVSIPASVRSIGYAAFFYCTGLSTVVIPLSTQSVAKNAFEDTACCGEAIGCAFVAGTFVRDCRALPYPPCDSSGEVDPQGHDVCPGERSTATTTTLTATVVTTVATATSDAADTRTTTAPTGHPATSTLVSSPPRSPAKSTCPFHGLVLACPCCFRRSAGAVDIRTHPILVGGGTAAVLMQHANHTSAPCWASCHLTNRTSHTQTKRRTIAINWS